MKIIVAPDSFKGSLSASQASRIIEEGIKAVLPEAEVVRIPLADGGEGTVQALVEATGGKVVEHEVSGPLGDKVKAFFGLLGDGKTAVIEMAAASGIPLVPPEKRNPMITTTYGTGELIKAALDEGCKKLIVGIGGSATNDGGAGMAQALGVRSLDKEGNEVKWGGGELKNLDRIDISGLDERVKKTQVLVACDVRNPLCGPEGASMVYGPQKGATPEMARELDEALEHFAEVIKRDLGKEVKDVPGAGAAGGLGAGLLAFLDAELKLGIEIVLEAVNFEGHLKGADLAITGEGKIDSQVAFGKTLFGVARIAKKHNVPVIALTGHIAEGAEALHGYGIEAMISILKSPMSLPEAMEKADKLLFEATKQVMRLLRIRQALKEPACGRQV